MYLDVPDDLHRSIVEDGRICTGAAPAAALAGSTITPDFVERSWRHATRSAINVAFLVLVVWT
ncbi:hypothetical protein, partial [Enterococcus faecium]|uniref:hypothetical protein n=3 Tax=Bacteria TaxID=2 RepID=UPI001C9DF233